MRPIPNIFLVLIFSFFLSNINAFGQEIPEIGAEEIPGYIIDRNESFNGGSLWGYMNGGADIYLEYGFEYLRVEELSFESETIKLELYKMEDPIAAFGIYSIKTFKCAQDNVISNIDCLNRYQFQLLAGEYYIQLINDSGSEKAIQAMISIAETLLNKIDPAELILPVRYLTDSLGISLSDINMLKGILGIQDKAMWLEDSFEGIEGYQIYYQNSVPEGEKIKYYEIVFDEPGMKYRFKENSKYIKFQNIAEDDLRILIQR